MREVLSLFMRYYEDYQIGDVASGQYDFRVGLSSIRGL